MVLKNRLTAVKSFIAASLLVPVLAFAQTAPDFTGMTDQIDWSSAITAVLLIAGGLAGVYVVIKGARIIMGMIKGG